MRIPMVIRHGILSFLHHTSHAYSPQTFRKFRSTRPIPVYSGLSGLFGLLGPFQSIPLWQNMEFSPIVCNRLHIFFIILL